MFLGLAVALVAGGVLYDDDLKTEEFFWGAAPWGLNHGGWGGPWGYRGGPWGPGGWGYGSPYAGFSAGIGPFGVGFGLGKEDLFVF